jgi:hypothetical protein
VEELGSEDDTDTQGVGLASSGSARFASDPLRFTGIDLGDTGSLRSRRSHAYPQEGEEDDDTSEDDDDDDDSEQGSDMDDGNGDPDNQVQLALRDKEEALVEAALARIRRAQAKGKKDVKLSKGELTALERRRERINAENSRKKRREKEQRIAVPISQLEPPTRKRRSVVPEDVSPNSAVPGAFGGEPEHTNYPPMGYFPPPLTGRSRPRSGTSVSQRPPSRDPNSERSSDSSPFRYSYVQTSNYPPSTARQFSDPMARPPPRQGGPHPYEDDWAPPGSRPASRQSQGGLDPFIYMTGGSRRSSYHAGPAPPRRHRSGSAAADMGPYMYGPGPGAFPRAATPTPASGGGSRRSSPEEETSGETTSDDDEEPSPGDRPAQGTRAGAATRSKRGRTRNDVIVVEDSPGLEPEPEPRRHREPEREPSSQRASKKSSAATSPSKRKTGASGRRRKGK